MSQVLTVPTNFNDIGELSEGFLDRVEQDTLILYGPVAYEDGSDIEFAVLLADGTPALEGRGRVRAAVDGGADRVPETRYDVVVEALEFDGRYEVVFERLVLTRQEVSDHPDAADDELPTDETAGAPSTVSIEGEVGADEVFSVPPDEVDSIAPEESEPVAARPHTLQTDDDERKGAFERGIAAAPRVGMPVPIPSMAAPPEAPPPPPTLRLAAPPAGLTRPSFGQVQESTFTVDGEVSDVHTTGLFSYEDGLPIPSRPPLPDPNGPRRTAAVEAVARHDVEDSDPPEAHDDEYEEVRLSDFAERAEEG
jgi:hypothetical protein